jgi:hypothetical protein
MNISTTSSSNLFETLARHSFPLRSLFYLVSPSETYYKRVKDVPDFTGKVMLE